MDISVGAAFPYSSAGRSWLSISSIGLSMFSFLTIVARSRTCWLVNSKASASGAIAKCNAISFALGRVATTAMRFDHASSPTTAGIVSGIERLACLPPNPMRSRTRAGVTLESLGGSAALVAEPSPETVGGALLREIESPLQPPPQSKRHRSAPTTLGMFLIGPLICNNRGSSTRRYRRPHNRCRNRTTEPHRTCSSIACKEAARRLRRTGYATSVTSRLPTCTLQAFE